MESSDFDKDSFYSICHIDKFGNINHVGVFFRTIEKARSFADRDPLAVVIEMHFPD